MFGVAIASSSPAVGARCSHARGGAGAVATQNITDPALGPAILDSLARGVPVQEALQAALNSTEFAEYRQLLVLGRHGTPLIHSGRHALGVAGWAAEKTARPREIFLPTPMCPPPWLRRSTRLTATWVIACFKP